MKRKTTTLSETLSKKYDIQLMRLKVADVNIQLLVSMNTAPKS
jgi:hypothetical protein